MLVDSHTHLTKEYFKDIDKIIEKAEFKNVNKLIASCCDVVDIPEYLELIKKDNIYLCLGLHPDRAEVYNDKDLVKIKEVLDTKNDKILAVGEIGLDYYYQPFDKVKQQKLFRSMLEIADKYKLPVVIHSRDATQDTIDILKDYPNIKGVIHCFSGSVETAKEYIAMGYYLGIGGVVTFKNSKLKNVIKEIGLENVVLETDSPFLSPFRGEKNEPANIYEIARFIAKLLDIDIKDVADITTKNVNDIFNTNF